MDELRLECVVTCVGFDDILDVALAHNCAHFDSIIVVTAHQDKNTHRVAQKHGVTCVQTDLFYKNGRLFNKGAAINAGFSRFQYKGWRMHADSDILLPDNFRRLLFNHTHLDRDCIYGADRVDVMGREGLDRFLRPQHSERCFLNPGKHPISPRYLDPLNHWVPIGYFQLFHASCQKMYPWSLGDASHDDIAFAVQWPEANRRLLPSVIVAHLCPEPPKLGQNWEGRKSRRL